ncbi:MAG: CHAT domain-containing protein [Pegethrix bostrychoides GSE-TBD4-15B]|uniref:CHAT domain-containing protein n=1 Tax=Pegethrix bostrychoides GSE-TBD4-15B TaxID=2839662 RepID=A0A951PBU9_9CYAN|nr:CHAT domain-containing protein [Pegethrix bostrychoides GSE-TBD4-15B]
MSLDLFVQDKIGDSTSLDITIQCQEYQIQDKRTIDPPLSKEKVDGFIERLGKISRGILSRDDAEALRDIGVKLYSSIFRDDWSEYLMTVVRGIHKADNLQQGLRINVHACGEIAETTPWELLCDPKNRGFIGCSSSSTIVRVPEADLRGETQTMEPPVRILLAGASPINRSSVHARDEIDKIHQCLKKPLLTQQATVNKRLKVSWKRFRRSVKELKPHILHLVAHGSEQGILFQNGDNCDTPISCEALYNFLGDIEELRLVVLNICASESVIKRQFALHPRRIPSSNGIWAIVVTRATISSDSSYEFSQALYQAIAEGRSIVQAVGEARNYLQGMNAPKGLEWITPALYEACNVVPFPPLTPIREIVNGTPLSTEYIYQIRKKQNDLNDLADYIMGVTSILENPHNLDISILSSIIQKPKHQHINLLPTILDEVSGITSYPTHLIKGADQVCDLAEQAAQVFNKLICEIERLTDISVARELASELYGHVDKLCDELNVFL